MDDSKHDSRQAVTVCGLMPWSQDVLEIILARDSCAKAREGLRYQEPSQHPLGVLFLFWIWFTSLLQAPSSRKASDL